MAQRTVTIYNRHYTISCDDGQEDTVDRHARALDERVRGLADSIGKLGDSQLLVIAGILLSDELSEAETEIQRLRAENEAMAARLESDGERGGSGVDSHTGDLLETVDASLNAASDRIEDLAERLSRA